jgi:formate/nitrite transporter FocA (FNT family)
VGGAELFTGNALISMAWASERVSAAQVLRHWLIVYIGNFLGAGATALLLYASAQYTFGNGAVGLTALEMARAKTSLGCKQAVSIKSDAALLASVGKSVLDYPTLSWTNFFWVNLLPFTVGNIIGGVGLVGLVYWFVYLRPEVNATTSLQPTEYERVVSLTNVPQ